MSLCTAQLDLSSNNLCGLEQREILPGLHRGKYNTVVGITAIADALSVSGSVTKLNLRGNHLGAEDKAVLLKAVEGRSGFELEL